MGILLAVTVIIFWSTHHWYCLTITEVSFTNAYVYLGIIVQTYLYTGLFITAHDSMHGSISKNRLINTVTGYICSALFAGLSYKKLRENHFLHHSYPGTDNDPDYCSQSGNFFIWWATFLKRYISFKQVIFMAILFNLLKIFTNEKSVWIFLVLPVILSTFQLFYFGTYQPHRTPHTHKMLPHNSRSQKKNHLLAMLSCYFFGYHFEHHESPKTSWWMLYKVKNDS